MKEINFLGLGFEVGQEQSGLKLSHEYVKRYFPFLKKHGLRLVDQGAVSPDLQKCEKLYSTPQVGKVDWRHYKQAYARVAELLRQPQPLLNWGGDHSVALATVGAFCRHNPDGCVVWIDAHTDINLPDYSLSGNLHGMPLSILLNLQNIGGRYFPWIERSLSAQNLIYVGVRDLDPFETEIVQKLKIKTYTAKDVRARGMTAIAREIQKYVAGKPLHVSFDIDSLSPEYAPSTGVPVADGLCVEDLKILGETLATHPHLRSVDIVEINPSLGKESDVFQTYIAALIFLMSVFHEGENYDGLSRPNQTINAASLEPRSQV